MCARRLYNTYQLISLSAAITTKLLRIINYSPSVTDVNTVISSSLSIRWKNNKMSDVAFNPGLCVCAGVCAGVRSCLCVFVHIQVTMYERGVWE